MKDEVPAPAAVAPRAAEAAGRRRRVRLLAATVALLLVATVLLVVLRGSRHRKHPDEYPSPRPPPAPLPAHVALVSERKAARAAGDRFREAAANARLAEEAREAAARTARAWIRERDPRLGLLPRSLDADPSARVWNAGDVAADLYAHLVICAHLAAPDLLPAVRGILDAERTSSEGLPVAIDLSTGTALSESADRRAFGAIEYAKDGLLPILECLGETAWLPRLEEIVARVFERGARATTSGTVVSDRAEKNGEMLQVLARLWRRTGDAKYLAWGRGIADAWVAEALPANGGLPPVRYDFARGRVRNPCVWLRDHGNEMVAGLVEWTLAERGAPDSRVARYAPAVEAMLVALAARGRDPAGLWWNRVGEEPQGERLMNDAWGYVSCAFAAYAAALPEGDARRAAWQDVARRSLAAATALSGANWEGGGMDGFADAIEGALYLLEAFGDERAADWIDDETGRLLAYQREDGTVDRTWLDGNFVRTCLLYARWRCAGVEAVEAGAPTRVGAVLDGDALHVVVEADAAWTGAVRFDRPRHRETLHLPFDYPRLNSWTEWFAVDAATEYEVTDVSAGTVARHPGAALHAGLPVSVSPGRPTHLTVRRLP